MRDNLTFKEIEHFLACPRKYYMDLSSTPLEGYEDLENECRELMNMKFAVEKPVMSTSVFGRRFISTPAAVVPHGDRWKLVIRKFAKRFKPKYALEASYHGYIFSNAGFMVSTVVVETPHFSKETDWRDNVPQLFSTLEAITLVESGDEPPAVPVPLCKTCTHVIRCTRDLVEQGSLSAIHGIGRKTILKLVESGIENLSDIVKCDHTPPSLSKEVFEILKIKATSLVENREYVFRELPELKHGVYLDIETHTTHGFDYLFGILDSDEYIPFFSSSLEEEEEVFNKVLTLLEKTEGPIYHYCGYEPSRFKELASLFKVDQNLYEKIRKRFVDVYAILKKHIALPLFTYSLKSVARYLNFEWRTSLNGMKSSRYFDEWLHTHDDSLLNLLLTYNEDDDRATKKIVEWLMHLS